MGKTNDYPKALLEAGLTELEPGPLPIVPKLLWREIEEWITAWRHAEAIREAGLAPPGALLLYGPTGTGKTTLARAILKYMSGRQGVILESHNVVTSMFGESAQNVARGFVTAERYDALLVVEEIDALGVSRGNQRGNLATEESRITIALMRHLELARIPVIATTNHREALDSALLRRFEMQIEVPALDETGRAVILRKILGKDAPSGLIALPLTESIRLAHRLRRVEFIAEREAKS